MHVLYSHKYWSHDLSLSYIQYMLMHAAKGGFFNQIRLIPHRPCDRLQALSNRAGCGLQISHPEGMQCISCIRPSTFSCTFEAQWKPEQRLRRNPAEPTAPLPTGTRSEIKHIMLLIVDSKKYIDNWTLL